MTMPLKRPETKTDVPNPSILVTVLFAFGFQVVRVPSVPTAATRFRAVVPTLVKLPPRKTFGPARVTVLTVLFRFGFQLEIRLPSSPTAAARLRVVPPTEVKAPPR